MTHVYGERALLAAMLLAVDAVIRDSARAIAARITASAARSASVTGIVAARAALVLDVDRRAEMRQDRFAGGGGDAHGELEEVGVQRHGGRLAALG